MADAVSLRAVRFASVGRLASSASFDSAVLRSGCLLAMTRPYELIYWFPNLLFYFIITGKNTPNTSAATMTVTVALACVVLALAV